MISNQLIGSELRAASRRRCRSFGVGHGALLMPGS
jgi:hypothetical protein